MSYGTAGVSSHSSSHAPSLFASGSVGSSSLNANAPLLAGHVSKHHRPLSTRSQSAATTFKSIVGCGISGLPFAFLCSGWVAGLVCLCSVSLMSIWTMRQLLICVDSIRKLRFRETATLNATAAKQTNRSVNMEIHDGDTDADDDGDANAGVDADDEVIGFRVIAEHVYGVAGKYFVDVIVLVNQLGGNAAFIALIASNIQSVLSHFSIPLPLTSIILYLFVPLALLSLPRSTTYLSPVSHLGNFALSTVVISVVYFGLHAATPSLAPNHVKYITDTNGIEMFFGIAAFALCGHAEMLAVERDAGDKIGYPSLLTSCMLFITVLYGLFGLFGYAAFGSDTASNILLNLGSSSIIIFVKLAMAAVITANYPISLFPATQICEQILNLDTSDKRAQETGICSFQYLKGVILRISLVSLTTIITLCLNDFGLLSSIIGSVCNGLMSFILPGLFWLQLGGADGGRIESRTLRLGGYIQIALSTFFVYMGLSVCARQLTG